MTNQTITIFLPIFFSVLVLCGLTLCACAYCQRSRGLPAFSFLHVFSRTEREDYDEEKVVEITKTKRKKRKSSRKPGRKGRQYGVVQQTTTTTNQFSSGGPAVQYVSGPHAQHYNIENADPSDVEEIEVVEARP